MNKQYLEYDPVTGEIKDNLGTLVTTMPGWIPVEIKQEVKTTSVDDMIKLKNSGFTAEEVIAIKKANL
ncbi:MAG: hypothetical protein Unbinned706contig1000_1 [Prokaryotic dsDNA virus sp.]|mgnify:CR=1 FL=1|nr:MAG: hypothetical protein Unbinned706contig1000_1 [Prokaryotic dsDNA virus sp.]|tara:strand:+ start:6093 stop:6296 length:204 start_codon:yes stop_codon:yes gene_type:complete